MQVLFAIFFEPHPSLKIVMHAHLVFAYRADADVCCMRPVTEGAAVDADDAVLFSLEYFRLDPLPLFQPGTAENAWCPLLRGRFLHELADMR